MDTLLQDVRFAFRILYKAPAFAAIAIITLALGIGGNTAIFSVIDTVLLSPLPFPHAQDLVALESRNVRHPGAAQSVSYPDFLDWQNQTHSFESMAAYHSFRFTLNGVEKDAISVPGIVASPSFFSVLQESAKIGRTFLPSEEQPGPGNVLVLSEKLWKKSFGGDVNVIGKTVNLGSRPFTVVGVMPSDFNFPVQQEPPELWTTIAYDILDTQPGDRPVTSSRGAHYLQVVARLRRGVSVTEARADIDRVVANLNQQYAADVSPRVSAIVPLLETLVSDIRPALLILFAAVGMVLLIACSNVSNLLFTRLAVRQKELAIRAAVGAGARRIVRQMFTEALIMSCLGGIVGLGLAWIAIEIFSKVHPANLPRVSAITLDGKVLGFAVLTMIVTAVLFGMAPAWKTWRSELAVAVKEGNYTMAGGVQHSRLQQVLIVVEMALTLMLLTSTSLLVKSLINIQKVDPGFDADNVLTFDLSFPANKYNDNQLNNFYKDLLPRISSVAGVQSVASGFPLPLSNDGFNIAFDINGRPTTQDQRPRTNLMIVSPGYFRTLRATIKDGREFSWQDESKAPPVVVVNEDLVKRHFNNEDPIGKYIKLGLSDKEPMRQIVGVLASMRSSGLNLDYSPEIYVPFMQVSNPMTMVVRTSTNPLTLTDSVRHQVASMDDSVAVFHVRTLRDYVSASTLTPRFNSLLLSLFAGVALVLTIVGLYGVISQTVAYRTREIGIRMAMGAQRSDVLKLILGQAALLAVGGIVVGAIAAFAAIRLIASWLFQVSSTDALTYIEVSVVLLAVALLAGFIPARRAMNVSPATVLK